VNFLETRLRSAGPCWLVYFLVLAALALAATVAGVTKDSRGATSMFLGVVRGFRWSIILCFGETDFSNFFQKFQFEREISLTGDSVSQAQLQDQN